VEGGGAQSSYVQGPARGGGGKTGTDADLTKGRTLDKSFSVTY
jgi:hypothetical protein